MSAFRFGLLAIQRRTDALGGERVDDQVMVETRDPEAVLRHALAGYIPQDDMEMAMTWASEMANQIITMGASVPNPEALHAAVTVAVAQCLGIGAATERSASGRSV